MYALILAEESGGNGYWFAHDTNEIILGTIAFLLVMSVLTWKAGPAIKKAMVGRTERIQAELDAARAELFGVGPDVSAVSDATTRPDLTAGAA